ncbi:MAG: 3-hydroxyacyl-CoA dehydrogenase family protein [Planctomycetes bacterium]|nr:3-hydroxyacyl-CoA dehydrogenase family protein [Planctomycetota bacterium]MBI3845790.1 3-hydroxyacyl-CoA dehydrogenase family protein [Planctomycetota bacterium]
MPQWIRSVAVLGAGTMGPGIAQVCARLADRVLIRDVTMELALLGRHHVEEALDKGVKLGKVAAEEGARMLEAIRATADLAEAVSGADLVIEAAPEKLALKREIFADVDRLAPPHAILATNTSSLSITEIAAVTRRPESVVGLHFFNPAHVMKLLEIVRGERTSDATVEWARTFATHAGKEAIVVRDSAGFATSRLGIAIGLEAMRMLEAGVATVEDIDRAMELGYGHPMGPLRLTDHVGLDVRLAIAEHLEREVGPQFQPPQVLRRMVRAGKLGRKSGEGFYRWPKS